MSYNPAHNKRTRATQERLDQLRFDLFLDRRSEKSESRNEGNTRVRLICDRFRHWRYDIVAAGHLSMNRLSRETNGETAILSYAVQVLNSLLNS